jgi:hypothetical protein
METSRQYFLIVIITLLVTISIKVLPNNATAFYIGPRLIARACKEGFTKEEIYDLFLSIITNIKQKKVFKKRMSRSDKLSYVIESIFKNVLTLVKPDNKELSSSMIAICISTVYYIISSEILLISENIEEVIRTTENSAIFILDKNLYTTLAVNNSIKYAIKNGGNKNDIMTVVNTILNILTQININSSGDELLEHVLHRLTDVIIDKTLNPAAYISVDRYDTVDYISTDEGESTLGYVSETESVLCQDTE